MLTAILSEQTLEANLTLLAESDLAEVLELRVDKLAVVDLPAIQELIKSCGKPIILTVRNQHDGGDYLGSEHSRIELLCQLAAVQPAYLDCEQSIPEDVLAKIKAAQPSVQLIRSVHNFVETPSDLESLLASLESPHCSLYKIVTLAHSSLDSVAMLRFVRKASKRVNLAAHCMGELGQVSRILGRVCGSAFTYATVGQSTLEGTGILSLQTLTDVYRCHEHNPATAIYALLGSPVDKSPGHQFHNAQYHARHCNAVYVKIQLSQAELPVFLARVSDLPWRGFSITMPLKETIIPLLDDIAPCSKELGAINTVRVDKGQLSGINTDGKGAIAALNQVQAVQGKQLLLLGAGGSAKAIAFEAAASGAQVTIYNRTALRAQELAEKIGVRVVDETLASVTSLDFIVNTIPADREFPLELSKRLSTLCTQAVVVMDINHSPQPQLTAVARLATCTLVTGRAMYEAQAFAQLKFFGLTQLRCETDAV